MESGDNMEHINITNKDIVNSMTDGQKHTLTLACMINKTEPDEIISILKNTINITMNLGIDLCNNFFDTSVGKEYLEKRQKIEQIGMK